MSKPSLRRPLQTASLSCRFGYLLAFASLCHAFLTQHPRNRRSNQVSFIVSQVLNPRSKKSPVTTSIRLPRLPPLFLSIEDSNDPFQLLGIDAPTTDKKVIKRAYKRMALKYHPDVATNQGSSPEEKKQASDRFAKINWAYEVLSGKRQNDSTYGKTTGPSTSSSSNSNGAGWSPPHRRSRGYSSSSSSSSGASRSSNDVDWTDFMPKYDDAEYETDGDSFGKIFSDLFVGAAAAGVGTTGPSVIKDFIDFLEGNLDGFGVEPDDDDLRTLLQTGSLEEIRNEVDDTELVVRQLKQKLVGIQDEIASLAAKFDVSSRYMEKIEMEEALAEQNARKDVVEGYVKKAQKRLLSLQTRYKDLLTTGDNAYANKRSSASTWDDIRKEAGSDAMSSSSSTYASTSSGYREDQRASSSTGTSSTQGRTNNDEDSWMNESFGSSTYGRGRGSGRRRSRRPSSGSTSGGGQSTKSTTTEPVSSSTSTSSTTSSSSTNQSRTRSSSSVYNRSVPTSKDSQLSNLPPHRRTSKSYESRQEQDKRRMRELKVDDEFEKLKKELGL